MGLEEDCEARCWRMFERKERRAGDAVRNVLGNSSRRMTFFFVVGGGKVGEAWDGGFIGVEPPLSGRLAKFPLRLRKSSNWAETER